VVIWAVAGVAFAPETGLSPAVTAVLPNLVQQIALEIATRPTPITSR
jgi:hypothetical protein